MRQAHSSSNRQLSFLKLIKLFDRRARDFALPLFFGILAGLTFYAVSPELYARVVESPCLGLSFSLGFDLPLPIPCPSLVRVVNDGFMTFFFALAMTHIVRTFQAFESVRDVAWHTFNPFLAMMAGVIVPAILFLLSVFIWGTPEMTKGFGIVTATDITVAWLILRLALGKNHPAISFLLLLALGDDIFGMLVIALFYSHADAPNMPALLLVALAILWGALGKKILPHQPFLVFTSAGVISWLGLYFAHLHPALALVPLIPFLSSVSGMRENALLASETSSESPSPSERTSRVKNPKPSPLVRFEHAVSPWVDYGLFFFGLTNAGVPLGQPGTLTWIILFSLFAGKTLGIYTTMRLTEKLHFLRAVGFSRQAQLLTAMSASVGLTVSLFMAEAAFPPGALQNEAKLGALFSLLNGLPVIVLARLNKRTDEEKR